MGVPSICVYFPRKRCFMNGGRATQQLCRFVQCARPPNITLRQGRSQHSSIPSTLPALYLLHIPFSVSPSPPRLICQLGRAALPMTPQASRTKQAAKKKPDGWPTAGAILHPCTSSSKPQTTKIWKIPNHTHRHVVASTFETRPTCRSGWQSNSSVVQAAG